MKAEPLSAIIIYFAILSAHPVQPLPECTTYTSAGRYVRILLNSTSHSHNVVSSHVPSHSLAPPSIPGLLSIDHGLGVIHGIPSEADIGEHKLLGCELIVTPSPHSRLMSGDDGPTQCFNQYPLIVSFLIPGQASVPDLIHTMKTSGVSNITEAFEGLHVSTWRNFRVFYQSICSSDHHVHQNPIVVSVLQSQCAVNCQGMESLVENSRERLHNSIRKMSGPAFISRFNHQPTAQVIQSASLDSQSWSRNIRQAVGSGYIDTGPVIEVNQAAIGGSGKMRTDEGIFFSLQLTSDVILESGVKADLSNYKIELVNAVPTFEKCSECWIYYDENLFQIRGLPTSQQSGIRTFFILFTRKQSDYIFVEPLKAPFEILVSKNQNAPNHVFVFKFMYSFAKFNSDVRIKLDILTRIAQFLNISNVRHLTVDRYIGRNDSFEFHVFKNTVGNTPCSPSQLTQIRDLNNLLTVRSAASRKASPGILAALSDYQLKDVTMRYKGACEIKMASITKAPPVLKVTASPEEQADESETDFVNPIMFVVVVICCLFSMLLCFAYKRNRVADSSWSGPCQRRGSNESFMGVKSRNTPVVFADEIDELSCSSINRISSFRIDKVNSNENGSVSGLRTRSPALSHVDMNGGASPPPPPPPPPPGGHPSARTGINILTNQLQAVSSLTQNMAVAASSSQGLHSPKITKSVMSQDSPRSSSSNSFRMNHSPLSESMQHSPNAPLLPPQPPQRSSSTGGNPPTFYRSNNSLAPRLEADV